MNALQAWYNRWAVVVRTFPGHRGRPGQQGGSLPREGGGAIAQHGDVKKYFEKGPGKTRNIGWAKVTSYTTDLGRSEIQKLSVYEHTDTDVFSARVSGGYGGSLNTWGQSGEHPTAGAAISEAVGKTEFLRPLGKAVDEYRKRPPS